MQDITKTNLAKKLIGINGNRRPDCYALNYDEKSCGIFLSDGSSRIMSYEDMQTLILGMTNFLSYYPSHAIEEYNNSIDQERIYEYKKMEEDRKVSYRLDQINYIKKYDNVKYNSYDTVNEYIKGIYSNLLSIKDKVAVVPEDVKYPVVLFIYNENEVVSIHKVQKKLEAFISRYIATYHDFTGYSYAYVQENLFEDVFVELIVKLNPPNQYQNSIKLSNSLYRTLKQIKKRYKGIKGINLTTIKNIIKIYQIPIYSLKNGTQFVSMDRFEKCLREYMGTSFF